MAGHMSTPSWPPSPAPGSLPGWTQPRIEPQGEDDPARVAPGGGQRAPRWLRSSLGPEETVEHCARPHPATVIVPVVGLALSFLAGWFVAREIPDVLGPPRPPASDALGLVPYVAMPYLVWRLLRWRTTEFVVTNHRVMFAARGLGPRRIQEVGVFTIKGVNFSESLCGRLMGYGTLRVVETVVWTTMEKVPNPRRARAAALAAAGLTP